MLKWRVRVMGQGEPSERHADLVVSTNPVRGSGAGCLLEELGVGGELCSLLCSVFGRVALRRREVATNCLTQLMALKPEVDHERS